MKRIMIVDDDKAMLQLLEMSLSQVGGMQVSACDSGKTALENLVEFAPEIVLLDANMPDIDGPETLVLIRQQAGYENVPIIFVTGDTRESEKTKLESIGAIGVITKPFDPMAISEQVNAIVERH
jgi:two-component system, OmpR family, response regulator